MDSDERRATISGLPQQPQQPQTWTRHQSMTPQTQVTSPPPITMQQLAMPPQSVNPQQQQPLHPMHAGRPPMAQPQSHPFHPPVGQPATHPLYVQMDMPRVNPGVAMIPPGGFAAPTRVISLIPGQTAENPMLIGPNPVMMGPPNGFDPRMHNQFVMGQILVPNSQYLLPENRVPPFNSLGRRSFATNAGASTGTSLSRYKSLVRPERTVAPDNILAHKPQRRFGLWSVFVGITTCCFPAFCLNRVGGMKDRAVQRAWREKVALCWIVFLLSGILGIFAFGLQSALCVRSNGSFTFKQVAAFTPNTRASHYVIRGMVYDMSTFIRTHNGFTAILGTPTADKIATSTGKDLSPMFPAALSSQCSSLLQNKFTLNCTTADFNAVAYCHTSAQVENVLRIIRVGPVTYDWSDLSRSGSKLIVYNGFVVNMDQYFSLNSSIFGSAADAVIRSHIGMDATKAFATSGTVDAAECISSLFAVGQVSSESVGCWAQNIIFYISISIVSLLVFIRFVLAVAFSWFISRQLGKIKKDEHAPLKDRRLSRRNEIAAGRVPITMNLRSGTLAIAQKMQQKTTGDDADGKSAQPSDDAQISTGSAPVAPARRESMGADSTAVSNPGPVGGEITLAVPQPMSAYETRETLRRRNTMGRKLTRPAVSDYGKELHTVLFVTCYSEDEEGLRTTFDSLAMTDYSEDNKVLFIVADGMIKGSGNSKTTPELILGMLELDTNWGEPEALSYLAIGDGPRAHNKAKAYVGWYTHKDRVVPTILVVKCGTEEEANSPKPGNRGKRDSQMILMRFFKNVNFDYPMSALEFDMFQKLHYLMGVTPDAFEAVLMVDADTKVAPDSLSRMIACMARDPTIMGLCGETRIANKAASWVTRIQVFEYYISHHLGKAFESMFGGVTCLPGCFCMYRIKTPKDNAWVPVLCNPDVVQTYSESVVDTLHLKNLLLLGEDRFLTTLMLRTFPRRKLIFVPRAFCKTTVPDTFSVLLSQRRRWINSTIHNLLELVLVRNLCGIFCCSMQFVILLELIGTALLPASIVFTVALIVQSIIGPIVPYLQLIFMVCLIGLPAVLILFTARRVVYIYWMFIYLLALPVWNFVLPLYAFWHFDDFSWGQTRVVEGESKDKDPHGSNADANDGGAHDSLALDTVPTQRWVEWEFDRRRGLMQKWIQLHRGQQERQQNLTSPTQAQGQRPYSWVGNATPL